MGKLGRPVFFVLLCGSESRQPGIIFKEVWWGAWWCPRFCAAEIKSHGFYLRYNKGSNYLLMWPSPPRSATEPPGLLDNNWKDLRWLTEEVVSLLLLSYLYSVFLLDLPSWLPALFLPLSQPCPTFMLA